MANCRQCGRKLPTFSFGDGECKWCKQYAAAQRGEISDDQKQEVMPTPWARAESSSLLVTPAIAAICGAVFIGMAASGASLMDPSSQELIRWGANFTPATLGGEWWRLLTSVFVHIGVIHIALNMWCLWSLGEMAEPLYGRVTFAIIYLCCGIAGSVLSAVAHPHGVSAGASGAIFGVAGALIASYKLGEFSLPQGAVQASLKSVATFAGYNLLFGMMSQRVDNSAHIGGLIMGLLLGAAIAKVAPEKDSAGPRVLVLGMVVVVFAAGIGWYQYSTRHVAHIRLATDLIEDGRYDEAKAELETALRIKPNDAVAHGQLAQVYLQKRDFERAIAEMEQASKADPTNAFTVYALGTMYQNKNEFEKAKLAYLQAEKLDPDSGYPHFGLAFLASHQNDHVLAVQEYRKALERDPEMGGANYNLGLSLAKLKRFDEAIAAYKQEISVTGDSRDAEEALAEAYSAKGMRAEADEAKRAAEKLRTAMRGENDE